MKTFLLLATLMVCTVSHAQFPSEDDKLHIIAGAVISTGVYTMVYIKTKDKKKAFWYSLGVATIAGITKETIDSGKPNNKFDTGEAAVTALGGLAASFTLHIFTGKKKAKKKQALLLTD